MDRIIPCGGIDQGSSPCSPIIKNKIRMKIITKYYDLDGRLKVLKNKEVLKNGEADSLIRFKKLNGKELPCCDFKGKCTNWAFAEVFPSMMKNGRKKGWSYLCKKHYYSEQKRLKWKLPACLKVEW